MNPKSLVTSSPPFPLWRDPPQGPGGGRLRQPVYQEIEHTADLALRVRGQTLPDLFAHAAYAMFLQLADLEEVPLTIRRRVRVTGMDLEALLVNWLNELLFLQETRHEVYREFEILSLSASTLRATVRGGPTESIRTMIKAATYHNLAVLPLNGGYVATLVFDV